MFAIADLIYDEGRWTVVIPKAWLTDNEQKCWFPDKNGENLASRNAVPAGHGWKHYDCVLRKNYGEPPILSYTF